MSAPIIPDEFMQWFRKNYPGPDTIIHKPDWHATRVYQAAIHASRADLCDPTQDERVKALEAKNARLMDALKASRAAHCGIAEHIFERGKFPADGPVDTKGIFADSQRARLGIDAALRALADLLERDDKKREEQADE